MVTRYLQQRKQETLQVLLSQKEERSHRLSSNGQGCDGSKQVPWQACQQQQDLTKVGGKFYMGDYSKSSFFLDIFREKFPHSLRKKAESLPVKAEILGNPTLLFWTSFPLLLYIL